MKKNLLAVAVASLALTSMAQAAFQNMTVDGIQISQAEQQALYENAIQHGAPKGPQLENDIRQSLIADAAILAAARKSPVAKDPNVLKVIKANQEQVENAILSQAFRAELAQSYNPSEAEITKLYNERKKETPAKEYQYSVIATKTKEEAQKALASLKKEKFAEVAKRVSIDPTAQNGGQLDFMFMPALDEELQKPAKALKVGAYTKTPIQVKGLWVILKLDNERNTKIPSLAEAKGQLINQLKIQHLQEQLVEIVKKAQVK